MLISSIESPSLSFQLAAVVENDGEEVWVESALISYVYGGKVLSRP